MAWFNFWKTPVAGGTLAGGYAAQNHEPILRIGDQLRVLNHERLRHEYRWLYNRGLFTIPAWTLEQAIQISPLLQVGVLKWRAAIGGLNWSVRKLPAPKAPAGATPGPKHTPEAEAQAKVLEAAYAKADIRGAILSLCMARFFGNCVLSQKDDGALEALDPWNIMRDGRYGAWYWNPNCRAREAVSLGAENIIDPATAIIRVHQYPLLFSALWIFLSEDALQGYWDRNLYQESKRQVVIIPGQGVTKLDRWKENAEAIAKGESGWVHPGNGEGAATSVTYPPASRGLPVYDSRATWLEKRWLQVIFGESLTTQSASGTGTLAGGAHQATKDDMVASEATEISRTLQEQFDRRVLTDAGLLKPGETPQAYFLLTAEQETDAATEIELTKDAALAGFKRDPGEFSERTGMTLEAAPDAPKPGSPPAGDALLNRFEKAVESLRVEEIAREPKA